MKKILSILFIGALLLTGCSSSSKSEDKDDKAIKIGANAAPNGEILEALKGEFEKEGYTLEIKIFDSYKLINQAVDNGELDANFFQHRPFLRDEVEAQNLALTDLVGLLFAPLGIYSNDTTKPNQDFGIDDVKEGAKFLVPNDPTNGARALLLLQDKGIIELGGNKGLKSTASDITKFNKNVEVIEMSAESIPPALQDADYAVINANYAITNKIEEKRITGEKEDSEAAKEFENIIAVREDAKDSEKSKVIKKVMTSSACKEFIEKQYKGLIIPTFE